jgi:hypothetical protein
MSVPPLTSARVFGVTSMQYSFWLLIRWFRISVLVKDTVYDLKHMTTLSIEVMHSRGFPCCFWVKKKVMHKAGSLY